MNKDKKKNKKRRYSRELESGYNYATGKRLTAGQKAYRHCFIENKKFIPPEKYKRKEVKSNFTSERNVKSLKSNDYVVYDLNGLPPDIGDRNYYIIQTKNFETGEWEDESCYWRNDEDDMAELGREEAYYGYFETNASRLIASHTNEVNPKRKMSVLDMDDDYCWEDQYEAGLSMVGDEGRW
jgi:hypothetical protein